MKNNNGLIIGFGVAIVIGGYFLLKPKDENQTTDPAEVVVIEPIVTTPVVTVTDPVTNTVVVLNGAKILQKGSTGYEVKELQRLLGISKDGNFGSQTEAALYAKKKVYKISLNQYSSTPNNVATSGLVYKYKIGDSLTVNAPNGIKFPEYAMGEFTKIFVYKGNEEFFQNNELVGKVIQLRKTADGTKPLYMVKYSDIIFDNYYLVSENFIR